MQLFNDEAWAAPLTAHACLEHDTEASKKSWRPRSRPILASAPTPGCSMLRLSVVRSIRADADPRDFLQLTGALWRAASGPEDRSQPMLGLVLDGLSA